MTFEVCLNPIEVSPSCKNYPCSRSCNENSCQQTCSVDECILECNGICCLQTCSGFLKCMLKCHAGECHQTCSGSECTLECGVAHKECQQNCNPALNCAKSSLVAKASPSLGTTTEASTTALEHYHTCQHSCAGG